MYFYYIWELPVFVLIGVLCGVLGALFIQLNLLLTRLRARFVPPRRPHLRLAEARLARTCMHMHACMACLAALTRYLHHLAAHQSTDSSLQRPCMLNECRRS